MERHPFKPYQQGHHFKGSCVQCGKPEADKQHTGEPDPLVKKKDEIPIAVLRVDRLA